MVPSRSTVGVEVPSFYPSSRSRSISKILFVSPTRLPVSIHCYRGLGNLFVNNSWTTAVRAAVHGVYSYSRHTGTPSTFVPVRPIGHSVLSGPSPL